MINFMHAVNMIEQNQTRQKLVAIMKNAAKKVAQVWNVAKTKNAAKKMELQKWIAAKMANAPKKDMTVKTAAKMRKIININLSNIVI